MVFRVGLCRMGTGVCAEDAFCCVLRKSLYVNGSGQECPLYTGVAPRMCINSGNPVGTVG